MRSSGDASLRVPIRDRAMSPAAPRVTAAPRLRGVVNAQRGGVPWAILALALAASLLGAGYYVTQVTGRSLDVLLRDANAIAGQPQYFGALDYAEVLLMSGAGWIALFVAVLGRDRSALFLGLGGLLSLLLALDNLYMLHESAWRFHLNEQIVFGFYGLLLGALVAANLRRFLQTSFVLLGIALALFALAALVDAVSPAASPLPTGFEDCVELVGVCFWSVYFVKCGRDALRERLSDRG